MQLDHRAQRPGSGGVPAPAPDGVLVIGPEGSISFANPTAADIFGYAVHEMAALHVDDLLAEPPEAAHRSHRSGWNGVADCRSGGTGAGLIGRRADGSDVAVEVSLSPAVLGGRPATVAVVRPVAEHRAREAEMRRLLVLAEEERIAAQLHDRTVRRLFLAAMRIQAVIPVVAAPVAERLHQSVDELDTAIREIRHSVFTASCPHHESRSQPPS